jgi:hypothetical protein
MKLMNCGGASAGCCLLTSAHAKLVIVFLIRNKSERKDHGSDADIRDPEMFV